MQSLNFENLNIGDIVLTVPKTKWHNIGNLGMSTSLYVVQSVDTENLTAVVANIGNGTANLLTTSTDGQTTIAPMSGNDPAITCEAFQMSHEEAIETRMGERTQAERLLGHHLESRLDTITPRPVDQFIEDFYAKAHSTDQGTNSYVSDITAGYRLMRDLLEGVRDMYDKESAKEATLLEAIREESSKVYTQIMALVKEADIKYVYSPEVVTFTTQAPYCNPRTFRVGTSIMREDEPYTITRVSATRAYITDINGEEVGYISSSKADGLKFTIKNAPVEDKRHRNKWEYATHPAISEPNRCNYSPSPVRPIRAHHQSTGYFNRAPITRHRTTTKAVSPVVTKHSTRDVTGATHNIAHNSGTELLFGTTLSGAKIWTQTATPANSNPVRNVIFAKLKYCRLPNGSSSTSISFNNCMMTAGKIVKKLPNIAKSIKESVATELKSMISTLL